MVGSCATRSREPGQARKGAAVSGVPGVPQERPAGAGYRASVGHLAVQDGVHGRYFAAGSWVFRGARLSDSQRTLSSEFQSQHPHRMRSMAYLSLYRKYRPQTFDEILGQEHVSRTLANAIAEDRVAHAYLFTGPRGTGKTSAARILAKALNCQQGPTPTPCNECDVCQRVATGDDIDVLEIDGASNRGIDEIRQLRQ